MNLYKLTNKIIYIGKTKYQIEIRFRQHCRAARRGSKHPICCAIRKYSPSNFKIKLLGFTLTNQAANVAEKALIAYWKNKGKLYNLTNGGDGSNGYKWTQAQKKNHPRPLFSLETRKRWSLIRKGKKFSKQWKLNISKGQIGRKHSKKTKYQIGCKNKIAMKQVWANRRARWFGYKIPYLKRAV